MWRDCRKRVSHGHVGIRALPERPSRNAFAAVFSGAALARCRG
jgi:hypothetical protein